ncbi:MAG TPA: hypothetical protein VFJ17_00750 [Mycobacteriales bacterium]|jgi:hypothetical protein|nr:hypothetical protein [Mycobacteriales bacterium]
MSDIRLPQRPMVELAPPIDGLEQVRGEAGRRRRRRAGVAAASLTTAAGVAVVLALSGAAGGVDMLEPAPPAGHGIDSPSPSATAPHVLTLFPAARHRHHAGERTTASGQHAKGTRVATGFGHGTSTAPSGTVASTPPPSRQVAGTSGPTLTRWQSTYTGATRECTGSTYGGGDGTLQSAVGWCAAVTATPLSHGVRLQLQLCRDSTGGGTLTFSGTREVDLAIRESGRTVWDWAKLHPGSAGTHQLSAAANGCWNWSLVWPDETQSGTSAGHGTFTFVGTSTANEMKGAPEYSTTFGY